MEDSADSDFQEVSKANYSKLSSTLTKAGYVEGITEGKQAAFQNGFDMGYSDGLKTAFEIAKWKTLRELVGDENSEENVAIENAILDAPEKTHYKFLENKELSIEEVSKLQTNYAESIKTQLAEDFKEMKHYFE